MILQAKQIFKSYGNTKVLSDVSLTIHEGESVAICGRSGSGKTTLLHILSTLEKADSGTVSFAKEAPLLTLRNQTIGFIFQSYHLLEDFTVLENVLMPAWIARQTVSQNKGLDLLDLVGLKSKAHLPSRILSGGEKQRLAIARALCNNPDLIFADEPTGNLDGVNAKQIGDLLFSLKKTIILVTHDVSLAKRCASKYHLEDGHLELNS